MNRDAFRAEAIRRLTEIDATKPERARVDYTQYETHQLQQLLAADGIQTSRTLDDWRFHD